MADSTNANSTTDSNNEDTNTNPNTNPNLLGVTMGPFSSPPAFCLFSFAGNAATGAFIGSVFGLGSGLVKKKGFKGSFVEAGSNAKTFAVMSGVHSLVLCVLKLLRGKDDVVNAGVAGCCTGLALSFPGAPQALLQSCVTFGAFSFIMEGLNKQQALAQSFTGRHRLSSYATSQTLALPLSVPLPDELKGAFSFFCNSLKKSKNGKYPTAQ